MPGKTGIASSIILGLGFITGGIGVPVTGYIIDHTDYATGFRSLALFGVAATVLAGDISLGSAVLAGDWVTSHERLGRNRP